jgi:hypothetical protein
MPNGDLSIRLQWVLTLALALVAAGLGYAGLSDYLGDPATAPEFRGAGSLDLVYYTAQLFVLDPAPIGRGPFPATLEWARFLAPATTLLAVVQTVARLFGDWIRTAYFRLRPGHDIVVGDGADAGLLARRLVADGRTVVLVGGALPVAHARRHGVLVVPGDPTDRETLVAAGVSRAGTVYALARLGATNAAVAVAVRAMSRRPVGVYAQVPDELLVTAMRSLWRGVGGSGGFRLDFFVPEDVAARVLLDDHPPVDGDGVVIVGFGLFPQAVLREIARRRRGTGAGLRVRVVTRNTEAVRAVRREFAAADVDVVPVGTMPGDIGPERVYVCYADADAVLGAGLGQQRAGIRNLVLCLRRLAELGEEDGLQHRRIFDDASGRLVMFGILDQAFAPGVGETVSGGRLRNSRTDRIARALHARYLRMDHGTTSSDARVPWEDLGPGYRADNYAQAADITAKLERIGARMVPLGPGFAPFGLDPGEVEVLAEREHVRWMDARRARAARPGAGPGILDHPDMLPWDALAEGRKKIDRDFVLALPEVLEEAGHQIVRDPPP